MTSLRACHAFIASLQKLKDSQVVEECAELLEELADYPPLDSSEALQITQALADLWTKYGCLDAHACTWRCLLFKVLRRHSLQFQSYNRVFGLLLTLSTEIFKWCKEALFTIEEQGLQPQYEVNSGIDHVFPEALLLGISVYKALEDCSFVTEKGFIGGVETYTWQSLNFLKFFCLYKQKDQLHDDCQRAVQELMGTALKALLKFCASTVSADGVNIQCPRESCLQLAQAVSHGVNAFMDLGKFAAENGRSWVGIMNVAWKGVTALLQTPLGKDMVRNLVDISHIIAETMICTMQALKNVAEPWILLLDNGNEAIKTVDFKRLCIPVKFFLINAVRISSNYPLQAVHSLRQIASCALEVGALHSMLAQHTLLRPAEEALVEIVEPSLFLLFQTLLKTPELELDCKLTVLGHLLGENDVELTRLQEDAHNSLDVGGKLHAHVLGKAGGPHLGRLALLLNLLPSCHTFGKDITVALARKLDHFLTVISDTRIYAEIFRIHVKPTYHQESNCKATWQCLYITILEALEAFVLCVADMDAWAEVEEFLFRNILHPHAICRELLLELWCFIARHSELNVIEHHVRALLMILNDLANFPIVESSKYSISILSRLICSVIRATPDASCLQAYQLVFDQGPFTSSSRAIVAAALLKEHFPTNILAENLRSSFISSVKAALTKISICISDAVDNNEVRQLPKSLPVEEVLCCFLELLIQETVDGEEETSAVIKMASVILRLSSNCGELRNYYATLVSLYLKIISRIWGKMQLNEIKDVLIPLHDFLRNRVNGDEVKEIRPVLAEALAGLSEVPIPEDETSPLSSAVWELYHLALRERHWALAHLALASFGYFAAHTTCNELWRFVPPDATLAFDQSTGIETDEELFMSCLRSFLEKEAAITTLTGEDASKFLYLEGEVQHKALESRWPENDLEMDQDPMDVDSDIPTDYTDSSLVPEINQALRMLQEGLSLLRNKLPLWLKESVCNIERRNQMAEQLSLLEDVIAQFDVSRCNSNRPTLESGRPYS